MKLANIVGARPQFIKLAPVLLALNKLREGKNSENIIDVLIHTGQHYDFDMSQVFFNELGLKAPDYNLGVGSGSQGYQTGEIIKRVEDVLLLEKPDIVIVYGDTNSTLGAALASVKLNIPVAHIESGLRSYNRRMPEEINRLITDHISEILFCPTTCSVNNLKKEGFETIINNGALISIENSSDLLVNRESPYIINVGDVMYDAICVYLDLARKKSKILKRLNLEPKSYMLTTIHRAENSDDVITLKNIFQGLNLIAKEGNKVIIPLHPRTRKKLSALSNNNFSINNLIIIEPVSYLDMLILEKNAKVILTDSGGVQKEAFILNIPCITLREETEWVETIQLGWNVLVGSDPNNIFTKAKEVKEGIKGCSPYGDGKASEKIFNVIKIWYEINKK